MSEATENKSVAQPAPAPAPAPQPAVQPVAQPATPQPTPAPAPAPTPQPAQSQQASSAPQPQSNSPAPKKEGGKASDKKSKKNEKKKKKDIGGRIIASVVSLILGFVLGVGSVYGTVAAVIYSIGTQPVDESVELIDTLTGLNLYSTIFGEVDEEGNVVKGGILAKKYEGLKLKDLVVDVTDAISGLMGDGTSIGDIVDISPFVGDKVNQLVDYTVKKFGIPITTTDLLNAPITGGEEGETALTDYLIETFMKTPAGDLINAFLKEDSSISPIVRAFCYGQEGIDHKVDPETGEVTMLGGKQKLTLNDFFGGDMFALLETVYLDLFLKVKADDPLTCSMAYGEKYRYTVTGEGENATVTMNQIVYEYTVTDGVYTFTDQGNEISYAECTVDTNATLATLKMDTGEKDENEQPVYETLYVTLTDGKVWQNEACTEALPYSKMTVGMLLKAPMSIVDAIALSDFLTIKESESSPIKSLIYADDGTPRTIGELRKQSTEIINQLKLVDFLGESNTQLHSIIYKTDENGDYLLDENDQKIPLTVGELKDNKNLINNIKLAEILNLTPESDSPLTAIIFDENDKSLTVGGLGELTLSDICVADILGIEYGTGSPLESILFKVENDEPVALTLQQLKDDKDLINNIKLADVLTLTDQTNKVLLSIAFVDGKYTFDEHGNAVGESNTLGALVTNQNIINDIKLSDVIATDGAHPALLSIVYQTDEDGNFILENGEKKSNTLGTLMQASAMTNIINKIKLADVIATDGAHVALLSIVYETDENGDFVLDGNGNKISKTLGSLMNASATTAIINKIKLSDVIKTDGAHPALTSIVFKEENGELISRTLGDLMNTTTTNNIINDIKLKDVITSTDPMIMSILYETDENGNFVLENGEKIPVTLGDLSGSGAKTLIQKIKLADVLNINSESHKALIFLAYGTDEVTDTPLTLGAIQSKGNALIDDIPLEYILTPNFNDKIITYLLYGVQDVHFKLENNEAIMQDRFIAVLNGTVYNEYGEALIKDSDYDSIDVANLTFAKNGIEYTLTAAGKTLATQDGDATIYYLKDSQGNAVKFEKTTLKQFSSANNCINKLTARLTARDVLGDSIDSNVMLKHLGDVPIDQLGKAVEELTFEQVFHDQIYRKYDDTKNEGSYTDSRGNTVNPGDYIDYDGNKILEGEALVLGDIWHYMLTAAEFDDAGNVIRKYNAADEYSVVNDMDKLIDNMKREVHDAQLKQLAHDDILKISDDVLNRPILTKISVKTITLPAGIPTDATIGDLTTEQVLLYVEALLKAIDEINGATGS